MSSDILVIIVSWNGMQWIGKALDSVLESSVPADVIVIDNGSTDGTVDYLLSRGVEVVLQPDNPGFGAANNIGIRKAAQLGYSYVYLLNQDAWLQPDTLAKLKEAAESDDNYGILSPMQMDGSGHTMDRQFAKRCGKAIDAEPDASIVEVPFVMAAHWFITRQCFTTVGAFSPAFRLYGEDDDYAHRTRWHGFKIGVVPKACAIHDRAQRPSGKERRMKLKYSTAVSKILNPCKPLAIMKIYVPLELLLMSIRNLCLTPAKAIPALLRRYPELSSLRKESMQKGAFL